LIDVVPGAAKNYEEAMDIVNCARTFGYTVVRLIHPSIVLQSILLSSGLVVYCAVNGHGVHTDEISGVFYEGKAKCLDWFGIVQRCPEIKGDKVDMPKEPQLYSSDYFGYEYIPAQGRPDVKYLPSMKAATGLCICTKITSELFKYTIPQLIERFVMAVYARSAYIFTRVTFPHMDPMGEFFRFCIVLSKTGTDTEKDITFESLVAQSAAISTNELSMEKWEESGSFNYLEVEPTELLYDPDSLPTHGEKKTKR